VVRTLLVAKACPRGWDCWDLRHEMTVWTKSKLVLGSYWAPIHNTCNDLIQLNAMIILLCLLCSARYCYGPGPNSRSQRRPWLPRSHGSFFFLPFIRHGYDGKPYYTLYTILYYTILYYTLLYFTILYFTIL
jgi:hypothetical protein